MEREPAGRIRACPEDFVVEERPLYEPTGEGQHLYLWIEKRGLTTHDALRHLARVAGCRDRELGYAGLKDARAISRQWISVPATAGEIPAEPAEGLRVLRQRRHRNKLKRGHLLGNRFEIRVREVDPAAAGAMRQRLAEIFERGLANRYGEQRFGIRDNSDRLGALLACDDAPGFLRELLGDPRPGESERSLRARAAYEAGDLAEARAAFPPAYRAEKTALRSLIDHPGDLPRALRSIPGRTRGLYLSALQSRMFNAVLERRLANPELVELGEVVVLARNGASFVVEDLPQERARAESGELAPGGPMFGPGLLQPAAGSKAEERERDVLEARGLTMAQLEQRSLRLQGQRRPMRVPVTEASIEHEGEGFVFRFELPKGCYATVFLEQVLGGALLSGEA